VLSVPLRGPYTPPTLIFNYGTLNDFVYGAFTHPQLITDSAIVFTSSFYTAYEVFTGTMPLPSAP
jgi:hypothetical protein